MNKRTGNLLLGAVALLLLVTALIFFPDFYKKHLAWRLDNLQTSIYYMIHPPQHVVFKPGQQGLSTPTPDGSAIPTSPIPPADTAVPTATAVPIPASVVLDHVTFIDQMHRWNYCGPSNLAMALAYWDWKGEAGNTMDLRDQIAAAVKPGENDPNGTFIGNGNTDVNVMPYELVDYVNGHTSLKALYRYGGDLELVKRLIAAGFPIIAEKGIYQTLPPENTMQWAGHYAFTTGYDDGSRVFTWQDAYTPNEKIPYKEQGYNQKMSYADYLSGWRAFDYVFIVVYPPGREADLMAALGPWSDETWAAQHGLAIARQESQSLSGLEQFFAEFNLGTNAGLLTDYGTSADSYDIAFNIYNQLPEKDRPYRILWYQTGPYKAYFYTSRYGDVINLAKATLSTIKAPRGLEESWYWKARAEYALGMTDRAYGDILKAYYYNRNLQATLDMLQAWGISP
jgi:hypothetical protein